jgi:phosphatidylserine/phosphatidylglycerophosphate/cardiolipin synthase-like enzyme
VIPFRHGALEPAAKACVSGEKAHFSARVSKSGSRYSTATYLTNAAIPVWVDTTVAIAHSKVMVIDGVRVITGNFNFATAAQNHNAENLLGTRGSEVGGRVSGELGAQTVGVSDLRAPQSAGFRSLGVIW